jgi:hypothetical protein
MADLMKQDALVFEKQNDSPHESSRAKWRDPANYELLELSFQQSSMATNEVVGAHSRFPFELNFLERKCFFAGCNDQPAIIYA